jgi:hypothetical protein
MSNRIRLSAAAVQACFENQTHQGDVLALDGKIKGLVRASSD